MNAKLKRWIFAVNALGFAGFLAWLASMSDRQILREQDGILYFLPCVPFLFVFVLLLEPKKKAEEKKPEEGAAEDGEAAEPEDGKAGKDGGGPGGAA